MNNFKCFLFVLLLAPLLVPVDAHAAQNGALAAQSIGTMNVTLEIPPKFKISNVQDVTFGSYSGTGDLSTSHDLCIYQNGSSPYKVTIADDNQLSGFAVKSQSGENNLPITVKWNDSAGTGGTNDVDDGVPLAGQTGANTIAEDCSQGGMSGNLTVEMTQAVLQAALPGSYSSSLTIIIEAD